jgi:hypothetical protein
MMLFAVLSWWYSAGWAGVADRAGRRIGTMLETFSVTLLISTLFDPFRQISADNTQGVAFNAQLKALGDRLFSRVFGAIVRSMFIIFGVIAALFMAVVGLLLLVLWPLIPLLPVIGAVVALIGWTL